MLVFIYPDDWTEKQKENDWQIKLMESIIDKVQRTGDMSLIPIIAQQTQKNKPNVRQIIDILNI